MNQVNQLHTCRCGDEVLAFLFNITPLEEGFNDGCASRWTADAVFFQCGTQRFILHEFTCRFHCTEQRCFSIELGRNGPFLSESGRVRTTFAFHEGGQCSLLRCTLTSF